MDVLSCTSISLWVDFLSPTDDLTVPDSDTVSYSLFSATGIRLLGPVALTPAPDATGVAISVEENLNTVGEGRQFDHRTVLVSWLSEGSSGSARTTYRVVPFPLYRLEPQDIRNVIGIASDELPDDAIDIYTGYLIAGGLFSSPQVFDTALTSGTINQVIAHRILSSTVVLEMLPSLAQRVLQSKTDGTLKSDRLKNVDLVGLGAALAARRAIDLNQLIGVTVDQLPTPTLVRLTTPTTDPVTGAAPANG